MELHSSDFDKKIKTNINIYSKAVWSRKGKKKSSTNTSIRFTKNLSKDNFG